MGIEDLMIGDFVKIKTYGVSEKYERTVADQYVKIAEICRGHITIEQDINSIAPYHIYESSYIEPIPLTPDILEKNGFLLYNEEDKAYRWEYADGIYINIDFKVDEPFVAIHNRCYYAVPVCNYVHQLQHAIRLCSIDKQIIL